MVKTVTLPLNLLSSDFGSELSCVKSFSSEGELYSDFYSFTTVSSISLGRLIFWCARKTLKWWLRD